MLLNKAEFLLVNNPLRAFVQEKYEIPVFLKLSNNRDYPTALEIGCGNGNGTRLIRKYYRTEKVVAVDLDERMIEMARGRNRDPAIDFMQMDASRLDFPDNTFDVVFDFGIIHHIPNWRDCIRELKRVLKSDGELILEEISIESFSGFPGILWKKVLAHPYEEMFSYAEFVEFLEENGFAITNRKTGSLLGTIKHFSLVAKLK